jgi:hypothetical protein
VDLDTREAGGGEHLLGELAAPRRAETGSMGLPMTVLVAL